VKNRLLLDKIIEKIPSDLKFPIIDSNSLNYESNESKQKQVVEFHKRIFDPEVSLEN
jgi:hypothetical protein